MTGHVRVRGAAIGVAALVLVAGCGGMGNPLTSESGPGGATPPPVPREGCDLISKETRDSLIPKATLVGDVTQGEAGGVSSASCAVRTDSVDVDVPYDTVEVKVSRYPAGGATGAVYHTAKDAFQTCRREFSRPFPNGDARVFFDVPDIGDRSFGAYDSGIEVDGEMLLHTTVVCLHDGTDHVKAMYHVDQDREISGKELEDGVTLVAADVLDNLKT